MTNNKPTVETRRWTMADGRAIVGDTGGDPAAPTVVLMHGGGQTRHSWAGAVDALLRQGYHVINYDAAGHGDSDWSEVYTLHSRSSDLMTIIEQANGPVALVGASLGGATAMRAVAHGYQPAALALVDIVPRPDLRGVKRIRDFMLANSDGFASLDAVADAIAAYNPHRPRPRDNGGLMRNVRLRDNGRYYWHWDPRILATDLDEELKEFEDVVAGLQSARNVPLLLVRGLASDVVDDHGIAELTHTMPHMEIWDVAGAGHMVAGDRNDAFNQGVLDFLSRTMPA
ncbi:alpha/beta hydrolase [Sphingobium aromaticiconvertens]|uniref:alpha/beta fold hydrolase n=1 Tax=Sphingobium aromaticiconvertens TaxID=365341 RepID=UPI00301814B6